MKLYSKNIQLELIMYEKEILDYFKTLHDEYTLSYTTYSNGEVGINRKIGYAILKFKWGKYNATIKEDITNVVENIIKLDPPKKLKDRDFFIDQVKRIENTNDVLISLSYMTYKMK